MSIKMNELQADLRVKFQKTIADGRITSEEWKNFSKEEQELLSKGLGGKTPTVGHDIVIKTTQKAPEAKKQERAKLSWGKIGKIGLKSIGNFFKGMVCDEKGFSLKRTLTTTGVLLGTAALAAISAPAALAVGAVMGGAMLVNGGIKAVKGTKEYYNAKTEAEAERAMEKTMDGGVEAGFGIAALFGVKKGYSKMKASKPKPTEVTQSSSNNKVTPEVYKKTKENGTEVTFERTGSYSVETRVKTDGSKCTLENKWMHQKYTEFDVNGNIKLQYERKCNGTGDWITTETVINNGKRITTVVETIGNGPYSGKVKSYKRYSDGELKTNRSYEYTSDGIVETRNYSGGSKKKIKLDNEPLIERTIKDRYWQGDNNIHNIPSFYYTQNRFEALW